MRAQTSIVVLLGLLAACGGRSSEKRAVKDSPQEAPAKSSGESSGDLMSGANLFAMSSMLSQLSQPGLYDAPKESKKFSARTPHLLTLRLSGQVGELEGVSIFNPVGGFELRALQERLVEMAQEEKVKGLLLRVDGLSIGFAAAQELRQSLVDFKSQGRGLYCHTEGISNVSYYLLSVCDSIGIAPTGQIVISGVAAMPMHLKGLLDKLNIKADFLHVGDYKGAAEPLTLSLIHI